MRTTRSGLIAVLVAVLVLVLALYLVVLVLLGKAMLVAALQDMVLPITLLVVEEVQLPLVRPLNHLAKLVRAARERHQVLVVQA